MPLEREFKLTGTLPDLNGVTDIAGFPLRFERTEQQTNTYYDTPHMKLRNAGMSLRLRHISDSDSVYTWKGPSFVMDGWHQKQELEVAAGSATNLDGLRDEEILMEIHRVALLYQSSPSPPSAPPAASLPSQVSENSRWTNVTILASDGERVVETFQELELEIKTDISGVALEPVIAALRKFDMTPSTLSKSARAIKATRPEPPRR
ncbi:MAG: CYTH domain-containing protein [Pleurocapsa sp. SU_196_0]|nr:CYTH domain-containing protein [Pleurocapsa sp. SU_196_0]